MVNISIYSDGACSGNPGIGGRGSVIIYQERIIKISGKVSKTTNNQMEMQAVIQSYIHIYQNILPKSLSQNIDNIYMSYFDINNFWEKPLIINMTKELEINIYTDSKYVFDGINGYIKTWKKNGRKTTTKQSVKNQDLWLELDFRNQIFLPKRNRVKGHSDNKYNNLADKLATGQIKSDIY